MAELGLETRSSDLKPVLFLPCRLAFPEECTLIKTELGEGEGNRGGCRVTSQEGFASKEAGVQQTSEHGCGLNQRGKLE